MEYSSRAPVCTVVLHPNSGELISGTSCMPPLLHHLRRCLPASDPVQREYSSRAPVCTVVLHPGSGELISGMC